MGNQQSSDCCNPYVDPALLSARDEPLNSEDEALFMNNMVNGCDTHIVFADGSSLPCGVMYDLAEDCLHLVVDEKRRVVALSDVHEILGPDNVAGLNNVERSMIINPRIVAFRLFSTKKAILLRFNDLKESQGFYQFLKEVIRENEEKMEDPDSGAAPCLPEEEAKRESHTVIF